MTRTELLDWTLEKNGLADAMAELGENEQPTEAMQKAIAEMEAEPPTLEGILQAFPLLANAYGRLWMLDKNGACCAANDIVDAWLYGQGGQEIADTLAEEIHATCNEILSRE